MAANLLELANQLTTVAAKGDKLTNERIHQMMTIYGVSASQRSLYICLHTRAIKELSAKPTETNAFDVIHLTHMYLKDIVGNN